MGPAGDEFAAGRHPGRRALSGRERIREQPRPRHTPITTPTSTSARSGRGDLAEDPGSFVGTTAGRCTTTPPRATSYSFRSATRSLSASRSASTLPPIRSEYEGRHVTKNMGSTDRGLRIAAAATVLVLSHPYDLRTGRDHPPASSPRSFSSPIRRRLPGVHPAEDLDTEK